MASEGPNSPGTMANDDTVGTKDWTNPDNAKVSDDSYAVCSFGFFKAGISHYLKATNFGFTIPAGATINGIKVEVELYSSRDGGGSGYPDYDKYVNIVKSDDTFGSENKATETDIDTSQTIVTYGGSEDLWSEEWTVEDINSANFGVGYSAYVWGGGPLSVLVDHIRITVYYTEGAGTVNPKVKVSGTFSTKPIKVKIGGSFVEKTQKVKVSGAFQ